MTGGDQSAAHRRANAAGQRRIRRLCSCGRLLAGNGAWYKHRAANPGHEQVPRGLARLLDGHRPVVTAAPVVTGVVPRQGGPRAVPRTTLLRCSCGAHFGQVSDRPPSQGGRQLALTVHGRHVADVAHGRDEDAPVLPWPVTVEQAIRQAIDQAVPRVHPGSRRGFAGGAGGHQPDRST